MWDKFITVACVLKAARTDAAHPPRLSALTLIFYGSKIAAVNYPTRKHLDDLEV